MSGKTRQIVTVGEAMVEIRREAGDYKFGFAGDSFNTAVYLQRLLGSDANVSFLTRVGDDPFSADFIHMAEDEGLQKDAILPTLGREIGIYSVSTDDQGERSFNYWRNQSACRTLFADPGDLAHLNDAQIVYVSGITLAILSAAARDRLMTHLQGLRTQGVQVAFDSNYRPRLWSSRDEAQEVITRAWQLTDIAFPSVDDEMALFGDKTEEAVLTRVRAYGPSRGALKRGAEGPCPIDPETVQSAPYPAAESVVDTTSAGDSFNAGYLAGVLQGKTDADCLMQGHVTAAKVIGVHGAIAPKGAI